jgi:uncharacterized protein YndB with AHSA1/START domain
MSAVPQQFENSVTIAAPAAAVWRLLTEPARMKRWLGEPEMQIEVETDWSVGGSIVVRGFHHARFTNLGTVLEFAPPRRLSYTHLSSLSRLVDEPASYTTFSFTLDSTGRRTLLAFAATGFPTQTIYKHLRFYWGSTLEVLKRHAERGDENDRRDAQT